ncbi:hypothetical protein GCM10020258_52900 [Sphingomonas yabuuchiae]
MGLVKFARIEEAEHAGRKIPIETDVSTITLPIEGMTCASCVGRVERAIGKIEGVSAVNVNLATERASITTGGPVNRSELVKAVESAGYTVPAETTELTVLGMTCASCVGRVERALKAVPGVVEASVNLATERATIRGAADAKSLIAAIAGAGMKQNLWPRRPPMPMTATIERKRSASCSSAISPSR